MSLQTYLASKYMSGPKADAILSRAAPKKKKRKHGDPQAASGSGSAMIIDDDGGWGNTTNDKDEVEVEEVEDVIVASDRSFKKRGDGQPSEADSGWITVKEPTPPPGEDEQPMVVDAEPAPTFASGLVTAEQLRKQRAMKQTPKVTQPQEEQQETVYRDASGRRIDMKAERAEAARKKREQEELDAKKMEWGKGIVQRDEEERKRAQLAAESMRDLARSVNTFLSVKAPNLQPNPQVR